MSRVRASKLLLLASVLLLFVASVIPSLAQSGVTYLYDQVGRLIGVIDPSGNAAAYSYDAVGNLLSISRYSSTQISLIYFTPQQGPIGTTVTISGSGFSSTPSSNTVTFNGHSATVTSASVNQLIVSVPSGASTGQIQVTSPAGTATSAGNFTVTADNGAPTITSISPTIATHGTSITVTGTNFSTNTSYDAVSFNLTPQPVTSATSTSINATVPVPTSSGRITVSTPGGTATSSQDLYIPFGTHSASEVGVAERTTIGTAATVSISTAGQIGLVIFDGTAGQKVDLSKTSMSGLSTCYLYLIAPNGSQIFVDTNCSNNADQVPVTLPVTGTYTVGVEPSGTTGSITVTVNNAGDATGTITAGGSAVTVTTTVPGQDARLTFAGTVGEQVYIKISSVTTSDAFVYLVRPDGSYQTQSSGLAGAGTDQVQTSVEIHPTSTGQYYYMDTTILQMSGTYTIWVQHVANDIGSEQIYLGSAPTPVTGTISAGGSPVTVTTTTAWQTVELTFTGTAGQAYFVQQTSITTPTGYVNLVAPDGSVIDWVGFESGSGYLYCLISEPLPMSGTYTVWVQNEGTDTGSETLALISMPSSSGTISVGGSPVTLTTTTAGEDELITFSGTAAHRLFLTITSISTQDAFVYMIHQSDTDPTVNNVEGWTEINPTGPGYYISPAPLAESGTYAILIQHVSTYTGSQTFQLYDVTTDVTGTITAGGSPVTAATSQPGQDARITFSGTSGENILMTAIDSGLEDAYVNLLAPDGTNVSWVWTDSDITPYYLLGTGYITLPQTGTYTLWVENFSLTTGSETLQLYDVPAPSGTLTSGGSGVTVTTTTPGQEETLTFSGTAGQDAFLVVTNVSTQDAFVNLMTSSGTLLGTIEIGPTSGSEYYCLQWDPLPATDTYTIWVQHSGSYTGSETLQLFLSTDLTGTITAGGSPVTVTTTSPGQNGQYTFSGTAGQNAFVLVTGVTSLQDAYIDLLAPDGTDLGYVAMDSDISAGYQLGTYASIPLTQTGTYTLLFSNYSPSTGSVTLQLYNPPADITGTLTVGGSPVTVTTTSVGQGVLLTFYGTAGQTVTTAIGIDASSAFGIVGLLEPGFDPLSPSFVDETLFGYEGSPTTYTFGPDTLPSTGTYTIWIPAYLTYFFEGYGPVYGSETVQVY